MKRGLVLSLCAVALLAFADNTANAQVDVQLNLRYDDPNDEPAGGSWDLLVQSGATNGLAGIQVLLDGITGVTDLDTGNIVANSNVFDNTNSIFRFDISGGTVEIVAGDDLNGTLIEGVGTGGASPGNVASDDLFPGNSPVWDNSALLASGTFGATRPAFVSVLANEFDNPATNPLLAATIGDQRVRGDSVLTDGLLPGDANRSGAVDGDDFDLLAFSFLQSGGWDSGDFNSTGVVDGDDFDLLAFSFLGSSTPPAISAVPEPSTVALLVAGALALVGGTRRRM